jgi:hypothetical protein
MSEINLLVDFRVNSGKHAGVSDWKLRGGFIDEKSWQERADELFRGTGVRYAKKWNLGDTGMEYPRSRRTIAYCEKFSGFSGREEFRYLRKVRQRDIWANDRTSSGQWKSYSDNL